MEATKPKKNFNLTTEISAVMFGAPLGLALLEKTQLDLLPVFKKVILKFRTLSELFWDWVFSITSLEVPINSQTLTLIVLLIVPYFFPWRAVESRFDECLDVGERKHLTFWRVLAAFFIFFCIVKLIPSDHLIILSTTFFGYFFISFLWGRRTLGGAWQHFINRFSTNTPLYAFLVVLVALICIMIYSKHERFDQEAAFVSTGLFFLCSFRGDILC